MGALAEQRNDRPGAHAPTQADPLDAGRAVGPSGGRDQDIAQRTGVSGQARGGFVTRAA